MAGAYFDGRSREEGSVAELTVIKWRDIPMQIVVRDDAGGSARRLLPDRFQEAVDAAAMVAGLIGSDDYTEQMMMDRSQVGDDLEAEATAAEQAVLAEWSEDQLKVAIRAGGYQGGDDVAGQTDAVRPSPA
jgi:cvfA/B/C family virulence factor